MKDKSANKIYNDFWKEIIEKKDGSINKTQLKKELADFSMLIRHVTKMYDYISRGRISYPQTKPEAVIELYEELLNEAYEEGYIEGVNEAEMALTNKRKKK